MGLCLPSVVSVKDVGICGAVDREGPVMTAMVPEIVKVTAAGFGTGGPDEFTLRTHQSKVIARIGYKEPSLVRNVSPIRSGLVRAMGLAKVPGVFNSKVKLGKVQV